MGRGFNRRAKLETANIGCMWGLMRMLHFRRDPKLLISHSQGRTQYFMSRYSKSKPSEVEEINEDDEDLFETEIKPTVKKLMEDEMTKGKTVNKNYPKDEIERILSDWGHEIQPEKKKTSRKRPKSEPNPNPNNSTESTDLELVLAAFLIEIYRYHSECKHIDCINKTGLCPTLKSIVYSKLHDRNNNNDLVNNNNNNNNNNSNNMVTQSKEFTNALEILSSNKELFLKILQDPDSRVLEKIQEINKKRERRRFFKRKDDEHEGKTDNSQTVSKIVILKPKATSKPSSSYDEKVVSNFSFKEIKRRLKHIIGENAKERNSVRNDPPHLFRVVAGTNNSRGSSFYEVAKKHLTEMLEDGGNKIEDKKEHVSLGNIISVKLDNLQKWPNLEDFEKQTSVDETELLKLEELEIIEENENKIIDSEPQHETQKEEIPIEECLGGTAERPEFNSPEPVREPSTSFGEKIDHASPSSVLDLVFAEEASSPDCKTTNQDEFRPNLLEDVDSRFEFVEFVIEASGLCKEESLERWYVSDELLEPSLFDRLGISEEEEEGSKLLFDCIHEVLIEIRKKRYGSAISVPRLHEVFKGVDLCVENNYPNFLDRNWMDLIEENAQIVGEIWDDLIDDLLEETVFDLWMGRSIVE